LSGAAPVTANNFGRVFPSEYKPQGVTDLDSAKASSVDPAKGVFVGDDAAQVDVQLWQLSRRVLTVAAAVATTVDLQTFWVPGWQATISGQTVETQAHPGSGTIEFPIPAGRSDFVVQFTDSPIRTTDARISLAATIVMVGLIIFAVSRRGNSRL
jgi:hypothetical protein